MFKLVILFFVVWYHEVACSIQLSELRVPGAAAAGGEALLGCVFQLHGDLLYAVSWYKDDRVFYKYKPGGDARAFSVDGVTVDLERSSSDVVTLVNLTASSGGLYRCEVTGEAPRFDTASAEKYITIHELPQSGPLLSGLHHQYRIGDLLSANCTSPGSRPAAQLQWLVNNRPAAQIQLDGLWNRVVEDPPDTTETVLGLKFRVKAHHFVHGVMQLKCQSTIAPLYQRDTTYTAALKPGARPFTSLTTTPRRRGQTHATPILKPFWPPDLPSGDDDIPPVVTDGNDDGEGKHSFWFVATTTAPPSKGNSIVSSFPVLFIVTIFTLFHTHFTLFF